MPTARKRSLQELDLDTAHGPKQPSTLHRIRNMWQFANLFQFIFLFGKALKLDDNLDIEVCRAPFSCDFGINATSMGQHLLTCARP